MQKGIRSEQLSEKEQKIMDILTNAPEGLTFTEILEKYPFSKGTFNRYLNRLVDRGSILKKRDEDHARAKYLIEAPKSPLSILIQPQWTKIITFFGEFGVPEDFIPDLVLLLSYMGDKFFELEQSPELYLALFYVYQNCIWVPRVIHIGQKEFCASYVKPFPQLTTIALEYHVNKLMTKDLGLVRANFEVWDYFFHVKDQFGQALHACVQESLQKALFDFEIAPLIQEARPHELREIPPPDEETDLDVNKLNLRETTEAVLRWLVDHQFLPENLRDAFYSAVGNVILACAVELRIPAEYLPSEVAQKQPSGIQTDRIRGFCNACGEWITWGESTCSYCRAPVDQDSLIADCVEARQRRRQYRAEIGETTFPCSYCGFVLKKAWQEKQCPACKKKLAGDGGKEVHLIKEKEEIPVKSLETQPRPNKEETKSKRR